MKILVLVQLLFQLVLFTSACTEVRVTSEDNSVVIGRSMEHMLDPESHIILEPMGSSHTARLKPENCQEPITWKHKYTVAYMDSLNLPIILGGMNNAGLSVSALMFPGFAKYQEVPGDKCATAVSSLEFTLWLLGNFATVKELREAMQTESFPLVFAGKLLLVFSFDEHYSVTDKTGEGIVIEFTENGRLVHDNTVGAVTNSPPYDFHMLNLRNYVQLSNYAHEELVLGETHFKPTGEGSGLLGMPGDMTPTSRFVRAAILANFAAPVKTSKEAVKMAYHILNTVDIPHGVLSDHKHKGLADYTSWAVAKDLTNNALYFRTYEDLTIRVMYLDNVQAGKMLKIKMASSTDGFKDVTGDMVPAKTQQHFSPNRKRKDKMNELAK